ncbi:MAG: tetratricopeptide repeat protein [Gammaproteobacteria bacterium]|nr:tetratricopeptide repeat protein [Gammaproteobacteria bacterium]
MKKMAARIHDHTYIALQTILLTISIGLFPQLTFAAEDDLEDAYKEGMYQREQGNLLTAIEAFNTILSNSPSSQRVRLELAVTYYRAQNMEEAKKNAQQVLDDPKTPPNVRISVLAFLAQIKQDQARLAKQRHTWKPSIAIGLMTDDNVNVGPSSDVIPGSSLLVDAAFLPRSDSAVTLQASLDHRWQSSGPVKMGNSLARFVWQSRAAIYRKDYQDEDAYDLDVLSLGTGPAWFIARRLRANINAQVDLIRLDGNRLATYAGLTPSITWQLRNAEVTLDAQVQDRDYKRTTDTGRDSTYKKAGVSLGKLFKNGKVAIQGGINGFDESADLARYSNDGTNIFAGANWVAWQNGSVFARVSQKDVKYDAPPTGFAVNRDERERRYVVGFKHNFKGKILNKWALSGNVTRTKNDSNVSIYTYDRDQAGITLSRSF